MRKISRQLSRELKVIPGVLLEFKQATIAIHYRHVSGPDYRKIVVAICRLLRDNPEMPLLPGKKVWELFPNSRVNKLTAIQHILNLEEGDQKRDTLVFYFGDDSIDERVFSQMEGISVVVGKHRRSAATFFLKSPAEVGRFLRQFCEALK